jgi:hypothetical protein
VVPCQDKEVAGQGDDNNNVKPRIVPQWRPPHQLTYVIPADHPQTGAPEAEVVVQNGAASERKTLSTHWPASSLYGFLVESPKPPATQPAATAPTTQH